MQKERSIQSQVFTIVAAVAICVLVVLDTWALIAMGKAPADAKALPANAQVQNSVPSSAANSLATSDAAENKIADEKKNATDKLTFVAGKYLHELGEYGFANAALVPNIVFNADGTFLFTENTGAGMGTCAGTYTVAKDGVTISCTVTSADISCPDVIIFTLVDKNAVQLSSELKKSKAGDSFIIEYTGEA